jgi:putative transposase
MFRRWIWLLLLLIIFELVADILAKLLAIIRARYAAQLICEGTPYHKPDQVLGQGAVGLDLGPSLIAVVSETAARLDLFCATLDPQVAQIRRDQRHMDRQRQANNPDNYLPTGQVKKGHKGRRYWRVSQRQRRTQVHLATRHRKLAAHRKSLHGQLAHQIVRQGSTFLLERVPYRAWQRQYGRSIQRRAPGMFVTILVRAAASAHGQVYTIPTRSTKLSQTCQCGRVKKKPLSLRVHACPTCGLQMQRDLYSAYLIRFVDPDTFLLHADQAQVAWPGAESLLAQRRGSRPIPFSNRRAAGLRVPPTGRGGGGVGQNLPDESGRGTQIHTRDTKKVTKEDSEVDS